MHITQISVNKHFFISIIEFYIFYESDYLFTFAKFLQEIHMIFLMMLSHKPYTKYGCQFQGPFSNTFPWERV